jgi:hypothetical protein
MDAARRIQAHVAERLMASPLDMHPFPHVMVEGALPDDIYDAMLAEDPFRRTEGKPWVTEENSAKLKTGTPYYLRKQILLAEAAALLPEPWDAVYEALCGDRWLGRLAQTRFPEYFDIRFGLVPDLFDRLECSAFLQKHDAGYSIGPHTDIPRRVATCILSLAPRGVHMASCGTLLCRPDDPFVRCWGNGHYSMADFRVVRIAPYAPNRLLLFYKARHSFHAVAQLPEGVPGGRFGLQVQLYEPKGGLFRDLSEPDLFETKHERVQPVQAVGS